MELQNLVVGLSRRKVLVALAALLGLALAVSVLQYIGPGNYRATATLLLDPNAVITPQQTPFSGDPERYVSGQLRLLESEALATKAAAKLPGETGPSVAKSVTLDHVVGSDLVDITASSRQPARARDVANALATAYVDQRRAVTKAAVTAQLDDLRAQIVDVQGQVARASGLSPAPQRDILLNQYQQLITQQAALTAPGVTQDLTAVVDPAVIPARPDSLPRGRTLALGLLLGTAIGIAIAVALEARAPHVGGIMQVERTTRLPVLARFPRNGRRSPPVRNMQQAARIAAAVLMASPQESKPRLIAVTALDDGTPTLSICEALVGALREQGLDVVVIDLVDVGEKSGTHQAPSPERAAGLTSRDLPSLAGGRVQGTSTRAPLPREEQVRTLVEDLPRDHEVVLLALPPVLRSPLAVSASRWVNDVIVVVDVRNVAQHELEIAWPLFDVKGLGRYVITR